MVIIYFPQKKGNYLILPFLVLAFHWQVIENYAMKPRWSIISRRASFTTSFNCSGGANG